MKRSVSGAELPRVEGWKTDGRTSWWSARPISYGGISLLRPAAALLP